MRLEPARTIRQLLSFAAAICVGYVLVLVATIFTGFLAAVPVPEGYWSALKPVPGLALGLMAITISFLIFALVASTSAALARAMKRASPAHALVCLLAVVVFGTPDLPASASLLWPRNGLPNVFMALSAVASLCAMPLGVWFGYRLGRPAPCAT